jgi:hypothetical protein
MATSSQITFSNDVGAIATASNENGSIRWHVYERNLPNGVVSIFVQRELAGVLQPEVRFIRDGQSPEVYFDPVQAQWIVLYVFNQAVWMLRADEHDAPVLQISQLGTFISHRRMGMGWDQDATTGAQRMDATLDTRDVLDATYDSMRVVSVGVGASVQPGYFNVRWVPQFPLDIEDRQGNQRRIAGFNVYVKTYETGRVRRVNTALVPFIGHTIHEYEVRGRPGYWMVTQVENWGTGGHTTDGRLVEGRLGHPRNLVAGTGAAPNDVILDVMPRLCGGSYPGEDVRLVMESFAPLQVFAPVDNHTMSLMGQSGEIASVTYPFTYSQEVLDDEESAMTLLPMGSGSVVTLAQDGYGSVVIG